MKKTSAKIPYATYVAIALNVAIFALDIKIYGKGSFYIKGWGAMVSEKAIRGEWWRFVTSNFLHYNYFHLIANMVSLFAVGRFIEPVVGARTIFVIYISSGIISGIAFSVFASVTNLQNAYLLGASASIMGIVGIILSVYLRKWVKSKSL